MKALFNDVIAVFTRKPCILVMVKHNLTEEEKAALVPVRSFSLGWIKSVAELKREVAREACRSGAAGYLISEFERGRFIRARATLFA